MDTQSAPPTEQPAENGLVQKEGTSTETPTPKKSPKFWSVFFALCLLGLSTSLEATIVTTALPSISKSIDIESRYTWVGDAFLLA